MEGSENGPEHLREVSALQQIAAARAQARRIFTRRRGPASRPARRARAPPQPSVRNRRPRLGIAEPPASLPADPTATSRHLTLCLIFGRRLTANSEAEPCSRNVARALRARPGRTQRTRPRGAPGPPLRVRSAEENELRLHGYGWEVRDDWGRGALAAVWPTRRGRRVPIAQNRRCLQPKSAQHSRSNPARPARRIESP